jgi:arginine utilization protein RocB
VHGEGIPVSTVIFAMLHADRSRHIALSVCEEIITDFLKAKGERMIYLTSSGKVLQFSLVLGTTRVITR